MKKRLFLFLAAAAVVTGCSKESVVDTDINKEGNKIGFATYSNVVKGNPIDNNEEFMTEGNAFGVTSFIDTEGVDTPYMGKIDDGVKIVAGNGKWDYSDPSNPSFWPTKGEKLDFFAYYPYTDAQRGEATFTKVSPYLTFDYTVGKDVSKQVDLMVAANHGVTKPNDKNTVKLKFEHALTQVLFKIKTNYENLTVELDKNGITLYNINSKATFELEGRAWGDHEIPENYTTLNDKIIRKYIDGYKTVGDEQDVLMLLPQTLENVSLTIKCKIYQTNGSTKFYFIGDENNFEVVDIAIPTGEWKRAQRVTYKLSFGDSLDKIGFETEVEKWSDASDVDIEK